MTPYERCIATIEGRIPDRVPCYTPTVACDVASKILGRPVHTGSPSLWYAEAKAWIRGPSAHAEFLHQVQEDHLAIHQALGNDVWRYPYRKNIQPTAQLDEYTFLCGDPDGVHQVWRWDTEVMNFVQARDTAPKPQPEDWPALARRAQEGLADRVAAARENTALAEADIQKRLGNTMLVAAGGGGLSIGLDEASFMACLLEPGAVGDILDCQLQVALAQVEAIARRGLRVVLGGGDLADKNGPMYSPHVFRTLMLPRLKALATRCNELGLHYVWRTDGKVWLISDMVFQEAGVPAYGEVDWDVSMTMGRIRERYPHVVVWANASGDILRRGSPQEVYAHAMQILQESQGRGYFHGCSNAILPGTPPENVWAMMQARDDYAGMQARRE